MLTQPARIPADIPLARATGPAELLILPQCRELLGAIRDERAFATLSDDSAFDTAALGVGVDGALFLNFDGLVEMAAATVEAYFALIARSGGDLLSVNHEAARMMLQDARQNWDIGRIAGHGLRPLPRSFFWERTGYVAQSFLSARVAAL